MPRLTTGNYELSKLDQASSNPSVEINGDLDIIDAALTAHDERLDDLEEGLGDNNLGDFALKTEVQQEIQDRQDADALLAPKANPTFTGSVTVPAPVNPTDAATREFVIDTIAGTTPAECVKRDGTVDLVGNIKQTATPPTEPEHLVRKDFVEAADTAALNAAKTYSDAGDTTTVNAANAYTDAEVLVEKNRAEAAEALLAPKANPLFTGVAKATNWEYGFENIAYASAIALNFNTGGSKRIAVTGDLSLTFTGLPAAEAAHIKHMTLALMADLSNRVITIPGSCITFFPTSAAGSDKTFTLSAGKPCKLAIEANPLGELFVSMTEAS